MPAVQEWIIYKACIDDVFRKCFAFWLVNVDCTQNGIQHLIIHLPFEVVIAIQAGRPFIWIFLSYSYKHFKHFI